MLRTYNEQGWSRDENDNVWYPLWTIRKVADPDAPFCNNDVESIGAMNPCDITERAKQLSIELDTAIIVVGHSRTRLHVTDGVVIHEHSYEDFYLITSEDEVKTAAIFNALQCVDTDHAGNYRNVADDHDDRNGKLIELNETDIVDANEAVVLTRRTKAWGCDNPSVRAFAGRGILREITKILEIGLTVKVAVTMYTFIISVGDTDVLSIEVDDDGKILTMSINRNIVTGELKDIVSGLYMYYCTLRAETSFAFGADRMILELGVKK